MKHPLAECDIIFLAGVHAVGKTSFCEVIQKDFDFAAYSASSLIKHLAIEKEVDNVKANQDSLILALKREETNADTIILDGHFCIQNKNGEIEHVPLDTFKRIRLKSIILLVLEPEIISQRILKRDNIFKSPDFIASFQENEINRAAFVSNALSVPLLELNSLEDYCVTYKKIEGLFK